MIRSPSRLHRGSCVVKRRSRGVIVIICITVNPKCCWNLPVCKYKHSAHDGIHFCVCLCSFRVTPGIKETRENLEKMERKWVRYMAWRFFLFLLLLFYITAEKRINIFLWFNVYILPCFVSRVMLDHRVHQVFLALWVCRWDLPT